MSRETESVESEAGGQEYGPSVLELWRKWYDLPALAILAGFMLFVRMQEYEQFIIDGEVFFSGNDAYYHYRSAAYTVRNWPFTMPYDIWTGFPFGTSAGQFGTLYDQIIATVALIVGLGSPDDQTIALVTLVAPAVFGALVAVPVYYLGQRLGGRLGGLFGVLVLAVLPGTFLQRSLVGFSDHHVAEVFFQAFAIVAVAVALGVAERELPVYEQILDRDWDGLREPLKWSVLAGVAIALYVWVWPPGLVLIGILAVFFTIALSIDYVRGRSPEHVAFVGVVSMLTTFVLLLVNIDTFGVDTTSIGLPHLFLALGVAAGCAFMAVLARAWDARDVDERLYPATVGGLIAVGIGLFSVVTPGLYSSFVNNVERAILLAQSDTALTVAEVQSPIPQGSGVGLADQLTAINRFMYTEYGLAYVTAYLALIWLAAQLYFRDYRAEDVFLIVYMLFTTLMALTQTRFNYYLVIPIAVMNAWMFGRVVDVTGVPSVTDSLGDIEVYQVMTLLVLLVVVLAPVAQPLAADGIRESRNEAKPMDVMTAGSTFATPSGTGWANSSEYMRNNTPEVGNYGGAGNADQIEYYGSYGKTDDYEYPEGSYGVISWWDYGHWITVQAERPAVANPFQQNPRAASAFFQAQNETKAELILDTLPTMKGRTDEYDELSEDELRDIRADMSDQQRNEETRYVMIDDQTAADKFPAVTQWSGPASEENVGYQQAYVRGQKYRLGNQNVTASTYNDRYRNTMLYELYYEDARGLSHYRLVHERDDYSIVGGLTNGENSVALTARGYGPWSQNAANVSRQLTVSRQFGQAVPLGQGSQVAVYNSHLESSLKTYERVPGATVSGTVEGADENTTVLVALDLETNTGRTFTYSQETRVDENGNFEITVPYATNEEVSPEEGGTDSAIEATGDYRLFLSGPNQRPAQVTNFTVSETAIYDGDTVEVGTVEPPEREDQDGSGQDGGSRITGTDRSGTEGSLALEAPVSIRTAGADAAR